MEVLVETLTRKRVEDSMEDIRLADLREWYAGTGSTDLPSILDYAYDGREYGKMVLMDARPMTAFGVDPWEPSVGNVWMYATEAAERKALSLHRALLPYLHQMQAMFPTLRALSDSRNIKHHRWLEWLGFSLVEETYAGPFGLPFKLYRRQQCA